MYYAYIGDPLAGDAREPQGGRVAGAPGDLGFRV